MRNDPDPASSENPLALVQRGLRRCALFQNWPDLVIDRLATIARLAHYPRGAQLLARNRPEREVKVVVSGVLAVSGVSDRGSKFMLSLIGPGELVGLVRLLQQGGRLYDYHAHEDAVVIHLPSEGVVSILDQTPQLWKDVALLALERQRDSIVSLQRRALGGLQQSVAQTLLEVASFRGTREPSHIKGGVCLDLSQSDLAHMVSVSRQTINKELGWLAQQGLLRCTYGKIHLLNVAGLRRIAEPR